MTTVDWIIIGIVMFSTLISVWRGAAREIFSLITWVVAIYLGVKFAAQLDGVFIHFIDAKSVRFAAGFIVIFIGVMIVGGLLNHLLSHFISFTGLAFVDRILGLMFGLARGVLILAVMVVLANYTTVPQDEWWKKSQLLPHFEGISKKLSMWVQEQGFDPKQLETLIDSLEGKDKGQQNAEAKTAAPPAAPVAPAPANTTNVLGTPVQGEGVSNPNMLGGQVVSPAKSN